MPAYYTQIDPPMLPNPDYSRDSDSKDHRRGNAGVACIGNQVINSKPQSSCGGASFIDIRNSVAFMKPQKIKQPRIARISRIKARMKPAHTRSPRSHTPRPSANILAPVAQANASECQFFQEASRRACLRDGSQDVAARSAAPAWGVWLRRVFSAP
jgi:hypothetical protein